MRSAPRAPAARRPARSLGLSDARARVERLRALTDEEREVRYALLPPAKFQGSAPIDEAAVAAYYKSHQAQFMTPEWVKLDYARIASRSARARR